MNAFLVPSCPVESALLPLAGAYVPSDGWPDFRLSASVPAPACSLSFPMVLVSQPSHVRTAGLTTKHRAHPDRQELILFLLQVHTRALNTDCPLGPEGDFRTPMPNLNIPSSVLAPWPFHFRLNCVYQRQCLSISKGLFRTPGGFSHTARESPCREEPS